jgi:hypothetical protein
LNLSGAVSKKKASSPDVTRRGDKPAKADSKSENQQQQATSAVDEQQRILDDLLQRSGLNFSQPESMQIAGAIMPQWNGVKIQNPMDPRIDLSTVGYINSDVVGPEMPPSHEPSAAAAAEGPIRYDHYLHLLEVSFADSC